MAMPFASYAQPNDIGVVVFNIAMENRFEGAYVGFAGTKSKPYASYEQLVKLADSTQLAGLCLHHFNAVVRLYAAQALQEKNIAIDKKIDEKMQGDNTTVFTLKGCIANNETLATIYKRDLLKKQYR